MGRAYDHDWRRVRLLVLERDGYRCKVQLPGCRGDADAVDHIVPLEEGGARLDPSNLRACCGPCNNARRRGRGRQLLAALAQAVAPKLPPSSNWQRCMPSFFCAKLPAEDRRVFLPPT